MAIALRGTLNDLTGSRNNGGDVTITFDTITPPLEDDIVVVFGGHGIGTTTLTDPGSGYTLIAKHETTAPIFGMWFKKMTATPDLSVVCNGGGTNTDGVVYGCYVLSGVDTTTAQDAAAVTVGPTSSTNPDAGLITTVTNDAWVVPCAGSDIRDTSPGTISGYADQLNDNRNETNSYTAAMSRLEKSSFGDENPAAWDSWGSSNWYAITAAFRPAPAGDLTADPGVGSLSLTGFVPTVVQTFSIDVPVGALTLTGEIPTVVTPTDIEIPVGVGSLTLTGQVPTVVQTFSIDVPVGSLILTGQTPTLQIGVVIAVPVGSLTLTGFAPLVIQTFSVLPGTGTLVLTGLAATVERTHIRDPPVGSLVLTGFIPSVDITQSIPVPVGSLTLTGQAPTAIQTFSIDVPVGSVTLTGQTPTAVQTFSIDVGVGSLTLSGFIPTLDVSSNIVALPGVGSLTLSGFIPTVIDSGAAGETVTPGVGSLTLTGFAPTAIQTFSIPIPVGTLTVTGLVPGITASLPQVFPSFFKSTINAGGFFASVQILIE